MNQQVRTLLVALLSSCAHTATRQPVQIAQESALTTSATEPRKSYAELGYPRFGEVVAAAGDVNGDGVPDFLVGDPAGWDRATRPTFWILSGTDARVLHRFQPEARAWGLSHARRGAVQLARAARSRPDRRRTQATRIGLRYRRQVAPLRGIISRGDRLASALP
jgi:hypothetical protein